jgi:hypothetical protein
MKKITYPKGLGIKPGRKHCQRCAKCATCDKCPDHQSRFEALKEKPSFAPVLQNMTEFGGCGIACKALRKGFQLLLPIYTEPYFTARLMQIITVIKKHDIEGKHGKRSIMFSGAHSLLHSFVFSKKDRMKETLSYQCDASHTASRTEATIKINDFDHLWLYLSTTATHFRVLNHLSVISDYLFNEESGRYEPSNALDGASAYVYSDYTTVYKPLPVELTVRFPEGTIVGDDCTVLQCIGIEFYFPSGKEFVLCGKGNSLAIKDVF